MKVREEHVSVIPYAEKILALGNSLMALFIGSSDKLPPPFKIFFTDCLSSHFPFTLLKETRSAMIAGTVIREVTHCFSIASTATATLNLGIRTWQAPTISIANADDKPPM
uniref:2-succinylbenzoateCoA ligaseic/peroxisomal-like isoform X3 n=1 Tax=Rhizophora mucronata TaxID=61149 RepID=A0A2P2LMG9_RHIMU